MTPLFFIHGLGDNGIYWDRIIPACAGRYRTVTIDLRGHGESGWDAKGRYAVESHAEDVLTAIDSLQLARPVLVGHSLGGEIALHIAATEAERVARLVLVDFGPQHDADVSELVAAAIRDDHRVFQSIEEYVDSFLDRRPLTAPDLARYLARGSLRPCAGGGFVPKTDPAVVAGGRKGAGADAIWAMLKALRCPTQIVRGYGSAVLTATVAKNMLNIVDDGRLQVVASAGHSVMTDNPDGFVAALFSFLRAGPAPNRD